jgi:hypothetical protein
MRWSCESTARYDQQRRFDRFAFETNVAALAPKFSATHPASSFNRAFRRLFGKSPEASRNSRLK